MVLMHGISLSIQKDDFPVIIFHIYLIYYKNALPHATFKTMAFKLYLKMDCKVVRVDTEDKGLV